MGTLVVTGGASGIGRGVAAEFCRRGWTVVLADRDEPAATAAAAELSATPAATPAEPGGTAEAVAVDVTEPARLAAAFGDVARRHGRIDALVTCAGITRVGAAATQRPADWRAVLDVDLSGTFYACQAAYPHLAEGGSVVTVASIAAFRGMARRAAYCAAKAGVVALTRSLATEWAARGIRVNCVAPGWVDTPFLREAARRGHVDLAELAGRAPLGGLAQVGDVVGAVAFLAAPDARFVTGQTLVVDGGWTWAG